MKLSRMLRFINSLVQNSLFYSGFFFLLISCSPNKSGIPKAQITLPQGIITLGFFSEKAPKHVQNFIKLAEDGFFDGTTFHRIIPGFVIQGGDPKSKDTYIMDDGTGTLDYEIDSEFAIKHFAGAVGMAKRPNQNNNENKSSGCQFYIALDSLPKLDYDKHTVFAYVEDGMDVLNMLLKLKTNSVGNPNEAHLKHTEMSVEILYEQSKNPVDDK